MKQAFKQQYMSNFKASEETVERPNLPTVIPPLTPQPPSEEPSSKKRRSRWN